MASSRASFSLLVLVCMLASALPHGSMADSGSATYYTTYTPSSCYGDDTSQFLPGNMIAAANSAIFNNKAACGWTYQISCTGNGCNGGGPITVKIVDLCPGCDSTQFDLSQEAFSAIADLSVGRISIDYTRVG
eukprot:c24320_g1_i1 orf=208-606(-)